MEDDWEVITVVKIYIIYSSYFSIQSYLNSLFTIALSLVIYFLHPVPISTR
ncbi:hypothetical protein ES702_03766 [subsurface metagenome]